MSTWFQTLCEHMYLQTWCKHDLKYCVNMPSNRRGSTKESQVDLGVREGGMEGEYMWGIEAHLKIGWKNYKNELI